MSLTKAIYSVYTQHSIKKYTVQYPDITTKVRRLMTILLLRQVVAGMTLPHVSFAFFLFFPCHFVY